MEQNNTQQNHSQKNLSEPFGSVPKGSESTSEHFRKENHTLSVRDVVKLFELKDVDITERSIINYCQPNRHEVCLLDNFYDQNERKYFITPESVEKAIIEVRPRKLKIKSFSESVPNTSEAFGNIRNVSETNENKNSEGDTKKIKELEQENFDLKITNRGKDYFIEHIKKQNDELIKVMKNDSTLIGELKTKLLQLGAPENSLIEEEKSKSYTNVEVVEKNTTQEQNEGN